MLCDTYGVGNLYGPFSDEGDTCVVYLYYIKKIATHTVVVKPVIVRFVQ